MPADIDTAKLRELAEKAAASSLWNDADRQDFRRVASEPLTILSLRDQIDALKGERDAHAQFASDTEAVAMDFIDEKHDWKRRAEAAEARIAELEDRRTKWENNDGMGGAVVVAIRDLLYAHKVPVSAYIDDHVRNALVALTKAGARVAELEEALAENARAAIDRGMALAAAEAQVAELLAEIRRWDREYLSDAEVGGIVRHHPLFKAAFKEETK